MFKCPKCYQSFAYQQSLKAHLSGVHGTSETSRSSFSDDLIESAVDVGIGMLIGSALDVFSGSSDGGSSSFDWSGGGGSSGGASGDW